MISALEINKLEAPQKHTPAFNGSTAALGVEKLCYLPRWSHNFVAM